MGGIPDSKARASSEKNSTDSGLTQADIRSAIGKATVRIGRVVRAGVGTYDFTVSIGSGKYVKCNMLSKTSYAPFGYSETVVPVEGSFVLFAQDVDATGVGCILGVVPGNPASNSGEEQDKNTVNIPKQGYTLPDGPGMDSEQIYHDLVADEKNGSIYYGGFRPVDVFPGEYVLMNEHGVGIDGDMLTMALRGGRASIAASRIDDTARIVCRNFRFYGSRGSTVLFTDAGCITDESTFSPYVGERTGGSGIELFRDDEGKSDKDSTEDSSKDRKPKAVIKARIRSFLGYLGGLLSIFVSKPDKNTEKQDDARRADDKEPKDNGLLQLNVNDNGRVMFRSAGGFVLERSDRIPVPVRINEYDSPGGVKAENIDKKDLLKFELPEDDEGNVSPHYMQLALNDKLAYDYRATYDRFIEHIPSMSSESAGSGSSGGEAASGDDFYLRNEYDLEKLDDDAGIPDRKIKPDDLEKSTGRRAGVYVLPSGEIVIRDAWGSEIIMSGGNVTINTPGNVKANTGYSFIVQAGDDIVAKARHSIDVDATENDITIKGERNIRIAAGSDTTTDAGGIVIESLSAGSEVTKPDGEDNLGEDAVTNGIVLKSSYSNVSVVGRKTILSAIDEVRVATGPGEDEREGQFVVATGQVGMTAKEGVIVACDEAGLTVTGDACMIAGGSVLVAGRDGVVFAKSGQIGVPIWLDFSADMVTPFTKRMQEYTKNAQKDLFMYPVVLKDWQTDILFTYRTSEQCHTWNGYELTDTPDYYTEYQPFWSVLANMKAGTMKDVELEEWELRTVNGEYPWPGTYAVENGKYVILDEEQSTEDETYNTKKVTVKIATKDENGADKEEDLDVVCSKDFVDIAGDDESENKMKVKLEKLAKYKVPVVSDQEKKLQEDK